MQMTEQSFKSKDTYIGGGTPCSVDHLLFRYFQILRLGFKCVRSVHRKSTQLKTLAKTRGVLVKNVQGIGLSIMPPFLSARSGSFGIDN